MKGYKMKIYAIKQNGYTGYYVTNNGVAVAAYDNYDMAVRYVAVNS